MVQTVKLYFVWAGLGVKFREKIKFTEIAGIQYRVTAVNANIKKHRQLKVIKSNDYSVLQC